MKIFLTGASGFLGSHTARELLQRGHQVRALVRSTSKLDPLKKMNLDFVEGSLPQERSLQQALEGVDAVIHVAGLVKALSEKDFFQVNAAGTEYLVREILALANKPKRFIHISTIAVHDSSRDGPDFCLPASACHPLSQYGRSKQAGEVALEKLRGQVSTAILRPPVLYGPGDRELLPLFKSCRAGVVPVYRTGENRLSVCYITDVARAIADLLESQQMSEKTFCLDSGEVLTWKTMALTFGEVMGRRPWLVKVPDVIFSAAAGLSQGLTRLTQKPKVFTLDKMKEIRQPSWVCGYQKLESHIGWKPRIKFTEGVNLTLQAYQDAGWIRSLPS